MKEEINEETFFKELMSKSKLDVPFSDFDDKVMRLVESGQKHRNTTKRDIRLSWICFLAGSVFGIFISTILPEFQEPVLGISIDKFTIPFQILFALIFVSQINNLVDFHKKTF
ncbi:MAG: hypothetical protein WCE64_10005 [Bacteroidales bacterium]